MSGKKTSTPEKMDPRWHGTPNGYHYYCCRCDACTVANRRYCDAYRSTVRLRPHHVRRGYTVDEVAVTHALSGVQLPLNNLERREVARHLAHRVVNGKPMTQREIAEFLGVTLRTVERYFQEWREEADRRPTHTHTHTHTQADWSLERAHR